MINNLTVQLSYRLREENRWREKELFLSEYFDLEKDEIPELTSVPKYMHAAEYLDELSENIKFTLLKITNRASSKQIKIGETF
jgi:hypothetical protein